MARFDNNASQERFIGNRNLDEVIATDTEELQAIGGSFEEIADKMSHLIHQGEKVYDSKAERRKKIFKREGVKDFYQLEGNDKDPSTQRGKVSKEIEQLYHSPETIDTGIEIIDIIRTRGFQVCPFTNCHDGATSSSDYVIRNTETGRELWINQITAHLSRQHQLLEKDNNYGISAREFYNHFIEGKNGRE